MADGITSVQVGIRGVQQFQALFSESIPFQITFEDDSIATDSLYSGGALVTVPGAVLGDFVLIACELDLTEMHFVASVQAADTVEVTLINDTAGTVTTLAAGAKVNGLVLRLNDGLFQDSRAT